MQKLKIVNIYNKEKKQYERNSFDIKESEKSITGRVNISTKKDGEPISKTLPFIAFKEKINRETKRAIIDSRGKLFDAEISLMVESFKNQAGEKIDYIRIVINEAKANGYQPKAEDLDSIPF